MKEGGESWMNDIRTYIESAHIEDYNPIHEFLAGCGDWDMKRDYIEFRLSSAHQLPAVAQILPPLVPGDGGSGPPSQQELRQLDGSPAHWRTGLHEDAVLQPHPARIDA